jgi:hypothetical protein
MIEAIGSIRDVFEGYGKMEVIREDWFSKARDKS